MGKGLHSKVGRVSPKAAYSSAQLIPEKMTKEPTLRGICLRKGKHDGSDKGDGNRD